jgi:hypothetical protein
MRNNHHLSETHIQTQLPWNECQYRNLVQQATCSCGYHSNSLRDHPILYKIGHVEWKSSFDIGSKNCLIGCYSFQVFHLGFKIPGKSHKQTQSSRGTYPHKGIHCLIWPFSSNHMIMLSIQNSLKFSKEWTNNKMAS